MRLEIPAVQIKERGGAEQHEIDRRLAENR
jgi:hypothetical protein